RPVEGELVRDFEPAEGWTAVIELTCVHFPIETPSPRFRRRRLDAGGNADGPPSGLLEVGRQQLASGIHQQLIKDRIIEAHAAGESGMGQPRAAAECR